MAVFLGGLDPPSWDYPDICCGAAARDDVSVRNLSRLFAPRGIAVVGASENRGSVGGLVYANLMEGEYARLVVPVNSHHDAVGDVATSPTVSALAEPPDVAIVCTPAATVPDIVRECGEAGVAAVVVVSAGFRETGPEGAALEREIEVNPLHAGPDGAVALDARVVLDPQTFGRPVAPYSHLAIRPYPEDLTTTAQLADGTPLTLRPIRPEDEPLWHAMLAASSEDSIRSRFRYLFKHATHEAATRFCFIDYDREMAIVAEALVDSRPVLLGVGRIVADPDRSDAEYAVLIADPWQGEGLAGLLTDRCLEIARAWGVPRVWAITDFDNRRMLAVLRRRAFELHPDPGEGVMRGTLDLSCG
jgi:GNAT superfamily N-acetyltransferase/predicted CoA-binding protein